MSQPASDPSSWIRVRGARTHNLKNVSVDLPAGKLIVITGVSGSGKSSLAFDTLFAEGQRRYLECVSVKTRTLLHQLPRPDVDNITGLAPTISVDQRVSGVPVRSTLATTSEIHDYLRLLYARGGTAHCTGCGKPVQRQSVDQIVARTLNLPERTRLMIMSPMVRGRKGAHKEVFERISRHGFVRVRVDGEVLDVAELKPLAASKSHTIDAVVDRIVIKEGIGPRIRESVELACRESDGTCIISHEANGVWHEKLYSTRFNCPECDLSFPTPEPRTLSFNSPWGACPECSGLGTIEQAANSAVPSKQSAAPSTKSTQRKTKPSSKSERESTDKPTPSSQDAAESSLIECPACHGTRLLPFPSGIQFQGVTLPDFCRLSIVEAEEVVSRWISHIETSSKSSETPSAADTPENLQLTQEARLVAERTLPDIVARLRCLADVGIGYLTLDRPTRTLSGGEFQRARLAASLSSRLYGAHYVLDEPTSGLHPRDTNRLIDALRRLRDSGGTVIVVEHDAEVMQAADWLVDLGPGAGADGGTLLFAGHPRDSVHVDSPTGHYLKRLQVAADARSNQLASLASRRSLTTSECLTIRGARSHNLQNVTVSIPLRGVVCVSGVSGSGKSSLIQSTLVPYVRESLKWNPDLELARRLSTCDGIDGIQNLKRLISLDQTPMGRSGRSCLVTLSSMWDDVRRLFAKTRDARARGLKPSHFSFNSGEGRCQECFGTGQKQIRLAFLPPTSISCPACSGTRFSRQVRSILFRGRSVSDILQMRVDEAKAFFSEFKSLHDALDVFCQVGLGYMPLGQPTNTFSGGEAQRARLAAELAWPSHEHTLYVLDEPTSGLHASDAGMLLRHLHRLADSGHSVVVIEHHPDLILGSDWVIDLGPEAASSGGRVLYNGPTENLHTCRESITAQWLFRGPKPGSSLSRSPS
ncbi:MAG: excinuclease ABC subunit UvrA [Planctomycetaceae bacterium]|nr:excinuclease ABC subunit UvrA [Planctomycetaceae bacterium]